MELNSRVKRRRAWRDALFVDHALLRTVWTNFLLGGAWGAIHEDGLSGDQTRALPAFHLAGMHADSERAVCSRLIFQACGFRRSPCGLHGWGDRIASVGALKMLGDATAELKSMRTHPDFLRRRAAAALLDHTIAVSSSKKIKRLSLETGSGPPFEPALALYRPRGFVNGPAFADYVPSGFNQFLHLDLRTS